MEENDVMREDFAEKPTEETSEERKEETLPTVETSEEEASIEPISEETVAPDASDEDYADAEAADISYVPAEAAVTMTAEAQEEEAEEAPEEEPDEEPKEDAPEETFEETPAEEAEALPAETPAEEEIAAEAPVEEEDAQEEAIEPSYEEIAEEAPVAQAEEEKSEESDEPAEEEEEMQAGEASLAAEEPEEDVIAEPVFEEPVTEESALKEEDFIEDSADAAEEILPAAAEEAEAPVVLPVAVSAEAPAEKKAEPEKKPEEKRTDYTWQEHKLRRKYKMDHDPLFCANDVIPGFIIARGEKVIRTYNCLASDSGDGTVCLTNKRLLVNAGERSEVAVEQISGIKFSRYTHFYFLRCFFALLFTAIAVAAVLLPHLNKLPFAIPNITGEARKTWAVILCYVGGGIGALIALPIWLHVVKKTFYFFIYAHQDTPFVQCKSASYIKSEARGKVASCMVAKAGKESEKAARELGALLIEIKEGRFDD